MRPIRQEDIQAASALLTATSLKVRYGAVEAVRGIDFEIRAGEIVAFLGANGAGKSSTLNALVGLVTLASGKVVFDGHEITNGKPETLVSAGLTLSPEGRRIFPTLSVADNLRMGAYSVVSKQKVAEAWERVFELFPILYERRNQLSGTLSGGQQQMLAVGRALMSGPRLLLLDEPSLGLAPKIVEQIFELIVRLREHKVTMAIVEQNVAMCLEVADRGYVMASGRIVFQGNASELKSTTFLQDAYLGGN
ncbi:ABC transporter ATP-binding protein [Mesorhizobium sophorae]|uniref:ABC transporter ATP-binding protein n=1 Tax=Mesorhizobium sophorae TaxID=1300294 RepID=UPI000BA4062D|nr:ABC transporter ATP-binding protein [Mesorhizobium sophorae]